MAASFLWGGGLADAPVPCHLHDANLRQPKPYGYAVRAWPQNAAAFFQTSTQGMPGGIQ
jgi:hypothetical protein